MTTDTINLPYEQFIPMYEYALQSFLIAKPGSVEMVETNKALNQISHQYVRHIIRYTGELNCFQLSNHKESLKFNDYKEFKRVYSRLVAYYLNIKSELGAFIILARVATFQEMNNYYFQQYMTEQL